MQIRNSLLVALFLLATLYAPAQTTYFPMWSKENWTLERLEIKMQRNNDLNMGTVKPLMRATYVRVADSMRLQTDANAAGFSAVDLYNLNRLQANSSEYSAYPSTSWKSKKPFGKGFFETPANMLEVNRKGFYMSINPAISLQQSMEKDYDESIHFRAFGASGRGLIGNKVAFHFQATANDENGPIQFRRFVATNKAVPGAGRYNVASGNNAYSYFDFRGSVATNVTQYINIQLGYDRNFIGNGYRSLMLSDFSGQSLFVKLNTRIWKLNYTNLFMQLSPTPFTSNNDRMNKKYAAMHHLSLNATPWLNIGFFESIIFGRPNRYDFAYMLPVIFYRSIEQQNGSPDNANIGFDCKANIAKKVQLYGQLMLDEFVKDEVIGKKRNWWGNKQGFQLGAKYVDAFGINNLDVQAEMNQIRPFMYQFRDTTGSYAHYNQPLAHPMGANLREFIGLVRYQPTNKLYFFARVNYWKQGLDSAGYNFGYNPNTLYNSTGQGGLRLRSDNYPMFTGMPATGLNAAITASYELKENLFVEAQAQYRSYKETSKDKLNTTLLTIGVRWNMFRKDYDY